MFDKPQQEHHWPSQLVGTWTIQQPYTIPDGTTNQTQGSTFLGSMMSHLWPYRGQLDCSGKRLPLNSIGPRFDGSSTANYRDAIEILSPDQWRFSGELQQDDGTWLTIMDDMHSRP